MKTILIANQKGGCGKTLAAISLATALSQKGYRVALADADQQKSALQWLKQRPETATAITKLDWRDESSIGEISKQFDYLIVDAPGALSSKHTQKLVSEADTIIVPLQPSFFDIDSTQRFLKRLQDIKRIRKGKIQTLLIANRIKAHSTQAAEIIHFFEKVEQQPIAWISERTAYNQLAMQGLSIFDKNQKKFLEIQKQWHPILSAVVDDNTDWF